MIFVENAQVTALRKLGLNDEEIAEIVSIIISANNDRVQDTPEKWRDKASPETDAAENRSPANVTGLCTDNQLLWTSCAGMGRMGKYRWINVGIGFIFAP